MLYRYRRLYIIKPPHKKPLRYAYISIIVMYVIQSGRTKSIFFFASKLLSFKNCILNEFQIQEINANKRSGDAGPKTYNTSRTIIIMAIFGGSILWRVCIFRLLLKSCLRHLCVCVCVFVNIITI